MKTVTGTSWALMHEEGEFYLESSFSTGGDTVLVRVPCGDGRYLAEQVMSRIIAPAIGSRQLDMAQFELGTADFGGEDISLD